MKEKKSTASKEQPDCLKEHPKYKGMYYYKQDNGRWSKDFYNLTRSYWYGMGPVENPKVVGQLPFQKKS